MKTSENINEIAKAMSLAQSQMTVAEMNSTNPHFRSKYSNLDSVIDAFRIPITSNGMTYWQDVVTQESCVMVTTRIAHSSGQWVEFGPLSIPVSKKDAHGIGAAITYAKRYALCGAMGVAPGEIDDDGNGSIKDLSSKEPAKKEEKLKKAQEKPESNPIPLTKEQTKELHELADLCDPEYMGKLYSYLESQGVRGFDNLMSNNFTKVITGMRSNAESFQKGK